VTKVVVDEQLVNGEGPPLMIYSDQPDQSVAAGS
jgi:ATP-dependent Clp protease ATP-binding subunit ClpX